MTLKKSCLKQSGEESSNLTDSLSFLSGEKEVSFHDIEIVEFSVIVGDNPSCRSGAPIALGNNVENRSQYDIDVYETFICPVSEKSSKTRRTLSVPERANL